MNKSILLVLIFLSVILSAFSAHAVETSGSASVDVFSTYVWRGQMLSNEAENALKGIAEDVTGNDEANIFFTGINVALRF